MATSSGKSRQRNGGESGISMAATTAYGVNSRVNRVLWQ
jgi:hypothetical protein